MKSIKKEDVEGLSYKDIAALILENEKTGLNTLELFTKIVELLELPKSTIDSKIAEFYTSCINDKRFLMLDGKLELRNRHKSDKVIKIVDDSDDIDLDQDEEESEDYEEEGDDLDSLDADDDVEDSFDDDEDDYSDLVVVDEEDIDAENN